MRAVLEIAIPLLLPALVYWLYLNIQEKRGQPVREVPLSWLTAIGVFLVVIVLVVSWFADSEKPGGKYIPPSVIDGKVVPGHFE
ncbi:DUF6111 family protein [Dongia sp.]|uniref:DUF6111 family protein n=1 Tax=Dongia sp. TaxID=1977262 RepID=UPI0035B19064